MKARTVLKWAIGVIALLAVVALAGVVWLFVAFYLDMEKASSIGANYRQSWTQDDGTSAINRRCSLSHRVS